MVLPDPFAFVDAARVQLALQNGEARCYRTFLLMCQIADAGVQIIREMKMFRRMPN